MIRRREDGRTWLVTHADHAALAADLSEVLAPRYLPPEDRPRLTAAVRLHEAGFDDHADPPDPPDARDLPVPELLAAWQRSCERAAAVDAWAGLLGCVHHLHLAADVRGDSTAAAFALIKFEHRLAELLHELRAEVGLAVDRPTLRGLADGWSSPADDVLRRDALLLRLVDGLSLAVCREQPPAGGAIGGDVHVRRPARGRLFVSPWLFEPEAVELAMPYVVDGETRVLDVLATP